MPELKRPLKLWHIAFFGLTYMSPYTVFDIFGVLPRRRFALFDIKTRTTVFDILLIRRVRPAVRLDEYEHSATNR